MAGFSLRRALLCGVAGSFFVAAISFCFRILDVGIIVDSLSGWLLLVGVSFALFSLSELFLCAGLTDSIPLAMAISVGISVAVAVVTPWLSGLFGYSYTRSNPEPAARIQMLIFLGLQSCCSVVIALIGKTRSKQRTEV